MIFDIHIYTTIIYYTTHKCIIYIRVIRVCVSYFSCSGTDVDYAMGSDAASVRMVLTQKKSVKFSGYIGSSGVLPKLCDHWDGRGVAAVRLFRPVYFASAGSVSLITFDIRHFPDEAEMCKISHV